MVQRQSTVAVIFPAHHVMVVQVIVQEMVIAAVAVGVAEVEAIKLVN